MKKFIGVVVVLGLIGGGGWYLYTNHISAEGKTCSKLEDLCGERFKGEQRCEDYLEKYKKMVSEKAFDKAVECVGEAESCMGASGCLVGGQLGGLGEFMKGVFKGLDPDLKGAGEAMKDKAEKLRQKVMEEMKKAQEGMKDE